MTSYGFNLKSDGCNRVFTKYYSGNQIEKNDMSGVCSMYGGKDRYIQDFGGET
jgi:hypothetical protein